ncbi:anhydro-N-acetylmuramic acid kinase [Maribacter vaceletii]|uniref:Anhydro-N-acetylmuramic acid kinase n=1 Tax=Maribacter vaceletii TaxID=1206816 RepID=A0A495DSQ0_9FLAO|nr:anhydro-N-acetylmuramic acid kinase [Maribacter vaceletii]RKR07138.1 anhydro-N-acetylmuramic acid kinase [Maribacter vaceletii]
MKNMYNVIGLMSGTSLDGLDLAYCQIQETEGSYTYNIKQTKSVDYTPEMKNSLKNAIHLPTLGLLELNNTYGTWLGEQTKIFIKEENLEVDFIASHGHTTHHQPKKGVTFQIGCGQHLANACNHVVINDFRTNDVSLGGQGAPLVPIGDMFFFKEYDFCLNLGGISNISFQKEEKRIAYDIGLANMILNYITQKIDLAYDKNGELARSGVINIHLLNELNDLEFYKLPFPKSIGYEWFLNKVIPLVDQTEDSIPNLLHTAVHHICQQIAIQIKNNIKPKNSKLLVTGGGALNSFLVDTLKHKLNNIATVVIPSKTVIEFKEALIFALMGVLRHENKTNVLSSVTGAKKDSCSGVIYYPQ